MTTYTTVADANGDFRIPFSSLYTAGEKVTVTAEKDGAVKTIELYAPSTVTGGGVIQISGDYTNFPQNIGDITITGDISGEISSNAFNATNMANYNIFKQAKGLRIEAPISSVGATAFAGWTSATSLVLGNTITTLGSTCFGGWSSLLELHIPENIKTLNNATVFVNMLSCKKLSIPASMQSMTGASLFATMTSCEEIICYAVTPPPISSSCFNGLKPSCIFKVPTGSVAAYQAAPNWSAYASRIQAI